MTYAFFNDMSEGVQIALIGAGVSLILGMLARQNYKSRQRDQTFKGVVKSVDEISASVNHVKDPVEGGLLYHVLAMRGTIGEVKAHLEDTKVIALATHGKIEALEKAHSSHAQRLTILEKQANNHL